MDPQTMQMVKQELSNPNSPYFLGKPSPMAQINGFLRGCGGQYNTNYFGPNKNLYLGQPNVDMVQIINHTKSKRRTENWFIAIGSTILAVAGIAIARKIPIINKIPKLFSGIMGKIKHK